MKVTLVARDVAPSKALALLGDSLTEAGGHTCRGYLGNGKPINEADAEMEMEVAIGQSDLVVLGMSSSAELAEPELAAASFAIESGTPFGFYADTYRCIQRPWFKPYRSGAAFVFVINEDEAAAARGLFPKAQVIVTGNPVWEGFAYPTMDPEKARAALGVPETVKVILCPGGKNAAVNILHLGAVVDAVRQDLLRGTDCQIIFAPHPGDKTDPVVYDSFTEFGGVQIVRKAEDGMSSTDLLSAADIVVESASTVGIEAAHCSAEDAEFKRERLPVIEIFSEIAINRIEATSGSRSWEPCDLGVAALTRSADELAAEIRELFDHLSSGSAQMLEAQERVFPRTAAKGTAVAAMIEQLSKVALAREATAQA